MTSLFAFGDHADGQLGFGRLAMRWQSTVWQFRNQAATSFFSRRLTFDRSNDVVAVACGSQHTVLLLADGRIYSCGNNNNGQLGHIRSHKKPSPLSEFQGIKICQIACGSAHSMALSEDGHLYSWGSNEFGQLGRFMNGSKFFNSPKKISISGVVQIACGSYHSLALCSDGKLYVWGKNDKCQLGINTNKNEHIPVELSRLYGLALHHIAAGESHSIALSVSGALYSWGDNEFGQLGLGDYKRRGYPVHVKSLRYQSIVKVFCGDNHTAALTKDGRLFTFGAGKYGQLGHAIQDNEPIPKQVMGLMSSKVFTVACGRCHTLALVGKKIYAWGSGYSRQLGFYSKQKLLVPRLVRSNLNFHMIFTGGNHSFAISKNQSVSDTFPPCVPVHQCVKHLTLQHMEHLLEKDLQLIIPEFETIFSNAACLNYSFLSQEYTHYGTNTNNSGVAMDDVMTGFEMLNESRHSVHLKQIITRCLESKLFDENIIREPLDIEALRLFIILPWCPIFSFPDSYRTVHLKFAKALLSLKSAPMTVIETWWQSFETRHLNRILMIFKQVVTYILSLPPANSNGLASDAEYSIREEGMKTSLEVLACLNKVNLVCKKLSFDSFYINEVADKVNIRREYFRFICKPDDIRLNICKYPFIFNAAVKTKLFETVIEIQQQVSVEQTQQQNIPESNVEFDLSPLHNKNFVIKVSRDNIVEDTISELLAATALDLEKPLAIVFEGEEGVDAGGLKKEFFLILFQELLNPKYGMFREDTESRFIWFTETLCDELKDYRQVGMLCGLAIYNLIIVALPFPLALYKKLLSHPTGLKDFQELSPTEGRSLEALLDYEGDDFEDVFDLTFQISKSYYGEIQQIDLKPNGSKIPVVKANRQEFVDLYVDYKLNRSIQMQFKEFKEGFQKVVTSQALNFFQPQELMEMITGNEYYDWDEFEMSAKYRGEYMRFHPTIEIFWRVFRSLTLEDKKKFLLFLTGSNRVPLLGMKQIKLIIQSTNAGNDYLPVAHTCFNILDLPQYDDEAILRKKLLESIEHNQGFSLV